MRQGLDGIAQSGVTDHEFELALGNITGGLALRFEGTLSRMNRLMGAELGSGEWLSVEEVLERFRAHQGRGSTGSAAHQRDAADAGGSG
ncbi:MAG: hypothetical protein EBZ10_04310 [Actinobacteria bacterium]|nr:hypothetical protein [Actinomycetota bacterium]